MKTSPILAAAIAAACLGAPAFASTAPSIAVDFRASDLQSQPGRDALEARLEAAAEDVCRATGLRGLDRRAAESRCQEQTLQQALDTLYSDEYAQFDGREGRITVASAER